MKLNERKLNWIVLIIALLIAVISYTKISFGEWAVTEDRIGSYSSELSVICNSTNTNAINYKISSGLIKAKVTPLWYWVDVMSNFRGSAYLGNASCGVSSINATNIRLWKAPAGNNPSTYLKFKVFIQKPHNSIK